MMFLYYFDLALRSFRSARGLTVLMVLTIAMGIGASMTTLTTFRALSGDPLPGHSDTVLRVHLDAARRESASPGREPDSQLTRFDAEALLRDRHALRQAAMAGGEVSVEPAPDAPGALKPFTSSARYTTADFFAMFDVPFLYGQAWTEQDDARGADVVVLSRKIAEKLFGNVNPVGQRLNLLGFPFTVVGVADKWNMLPRAYLLRGGSPYGTGEEFLIPLSSAVRHETQHNGGMSCSGNVGPGWAARLASECTWVTAWFETAAKGDRSELQSWLDNYANDQRKLGRLKRKAPNLLFNVTEWMEYTEVVGKDSKLQVWLAFGFLTLCLVNTVGLLLAKFSVRAAEIGVRRALGASRVEIFRQFLIETAVVGLVGGMLGLAFAFGALGLIGMTSKSMAVIATMDWQMLGLTFVISVSAAIVAGLLPTWRACQVTPAIQLKSQ